MNQTKPVGEAAGQRRSRAERDLHAHQMYVCVMDRPGKKLVHCNIKDNDFEYFLKLIAPYRHDLTFCAECMFGWYWLADACQEAGLTFVLAERRG